MFRPLDPADADPALAPRLWAADAHLPDPGAWRPYLGLPHAATDGVVCLGRTRLDPLAGHRAAALLAARPDPALRPLLEAAAALPCPADPVPYQTKTVQAVEAIAGMAGRFLRADAYTAWKPLPDDCWATPPAPGSDHPAEANAWTWNPDEM